ncbi:MULTISPECIES: hypothetical protein [Streptomyces]|uniref:hypothetical protein n=1 Tax=Streptomyces TaxID=1883 RepID=UPI0004C7C528|nr:MULTISPECIES: hypothetical protein [Streptomyces]
MIHDPSTAWRGPYPYEVLAGAGVTPSTTQAELRDLTFELLERRMLTPRSQRAWSELRSLRGRLTADLLLYRVGLPEAVAGALEETERALAAPGVPPSAEASLALPWEGAGRLVDELDGVPLPEPPVPPEVPGFGGPPGEPGTHVRFDE